MMLIRRMVPVLVLCASAAPAAAQVMVAPPAVVMNEREPFGTFLVINQSPEAQEVTIEFRFGYPVADSLGATSMVYGDTLAHAEWSLRPFVRAFPRQFVLEPGAQQVVRITGRPDAGAADGTYWTRIATASLPRSAPLDTTSTEVRAQVIFRLEQITTLLYRRGAAATGLTISDIRVAADDANVGVLATLSPGGNSPFLGQATVRVRNEAGEVVAEERELTALYVSMTRLFRFDRSQFPPGEYAGEITVTAERPDLPRAQVLQVEPVTREFRFRID
jgi:P pilus assembly chaperone PapD